MLVFLSTSKTMMEQHSAEIPILVPAGFPTRAKNRKRPQACWAVGLGRSRLQAGQPAEKEVQEGQDDVMGMDFSG
jgi:hypothetical protein